MDLLHSKVKYRWFCEEVGNDTAFTGAAAYTGSVTHSLSIAVIVCETTGQLCPLLPVLVSSYSTFINIRKREEQTVTCEPLILAIFAVFYKRSGKSNLSSHSAVLIFFCNCVLIFVHLHKGNINNV